LENCGQPTINKPGTGTKKAHKERMKLDYRVQVVGTKNVSTEDKDNNHDAQCPYCKNFAAIMMPNVHIARTFQRS
jgi:hypothetical protein